MEINQNVINRNNAIAKHLDHIIVMWQEGRMETSQAKMLYKFIVQRLVLTGHHELFADEHHYEDEDEETTTIKRPRYSQTDIETLKRLYVRGRTAEQIAKQLGRSAPSVRTVIQRLQTQKILPKRYKTRASASNSNINNNNEGK
jgi:hypothetical protein